MKKDDYQKIQNLLNEVNSILEKSKKEDTFQPEGSLNVLNQWNVIKGKCEDSVINE